jgi:ATP-dependent DNA helicase RecG
MPGNLSKSIQFIKGVGPKRSAAFESIGLKTVRDLLFYFPFKHLDRTSILNSLKVREYAVGGYEGEVTLIAQVETTELIRYGRKSLLKVSMKDSTGYFDCVWFQGIKFLKDTFKEQTFYAVSGKPVLTKYGHLQIVHPDFDRIDKEESSGFLNTGRIIPFYRLPQGLKDKNVGAISIRRIINYAVDNYYAELPESLPGEIVESLDLLTLGDTVKNMHFPKSKELLEKAIRRLKYEELFYLQILVAVRKANIVSGRSDIKFVFNTLLIKNFIKSLPFELTDAQLKVLHEIREEIESGATMNRLLQGDVGSGKTIVALITMMASAGSGYQAVLMAPTEVLASQHYINISGSLRNTGIDIVLLIGSQNSKERLKALTTVNSSKNCIIVGTHAVFEEKVEFNKLGLVVIDEQHRFGVIQRSKLVEKGLKPHLLVMTATPIPRTLTMTIYGDLDVSVIDRLPSGRMNIKTALRSEKKLPGIYKFIKERINLGEQAYIVYPLVEESEKLDLNAAQESFEKLTATYFKENKVGLLHGRMKWSEKEEVMRKFVNKEFELLISTTVVEVGIDVPNATTVLINDAHRFGLSQLHQLRGRVGRSHLQSYCILVTKDEILKQKINANLNLDYLSAIQKEKYKSSIRLNAMLKHSSGFELSEIDLKLRGPGDIFGVKQSGLPELKFAELPNDEDLLLLAKRDAFKIVFDDNLLRKKKNKIIFNNLAENYSEHLKLSMTP